MANGEGGAGGDGFVADWDDMHSGGGSQMREGGGRGFSI